MKKVLFKNKININYLKYNLFLIRLFKLILYKYFKVKINYILIKY